MSLYDAMQRKRKMKERHLKDAEPVGEVLPRQYDTHTISTLGASIRMLSPVTVAFHDSIYYTCRKER
jgi:hypothetical protein